MNTARPIWLFNSADVFSGNPKWLFLHVSLHRTDIEAWWISTSKETTRRVRDLGLNAVTFDSAQGKRLQQQASVYVVNQVKEHLPDELKHTTMLNLWHGVGVKAVERAPGVGYDNWRIAKKYISHNQYFRDHQLFLVTSPLMEEHFTGQLDLAPDALVRAGYPQNVYAAEHGPFAGFDHDLRGRRGLGPGTRIAMYSPTWRRGPQRGFLHSALPDVPRLLEVLEREDILLIVKMHPRLAKDPVFVKMRQHYADAKHLLFWDEAEDVYEVFPQIDIGIVDYSSILYDLLAAGTRRFVRYVFDPDAFTDNVRPGLSYEELSCGVHADSFEALLAALQTDTTVDQPTVDRLLDTFWSYTRPDSLDHIVDSALAVAPRHVELPTLHSFDVFDTVIHRRGVEPLSAFHYVRQRMRESTLGYPQALVSRFPAIRAEAEISARTHLQRQPSLRETGRLEIGFDDIYDRVATLFGLDAAQTEALMAWEVEAELASVVPDRRMVKRIKGLVEAGETVVLISDMYLPREVLGRLLAAADPVLAALPLYLSNDQGVQKTTKRLYLKVYEDLRYDFAEWVHTGDNPNADVKQAEALGIRVVPVRESALTGYPAELAAFGDTYDAHLVAGMLATHLADGKPTDAEHFAYSYVAPYLVPYLSWVVTDAVERGIRHLYFISRDGHHMRVIADALIAERGLDLRTSYIYGSRKVWRIASQIDDLDEDIFRFHGNFSGVKTPEGLLEAARLDRGEFVALFPEFDDLLARQALDPKTVTDVIAAMRASQPFRAHLLERAAEERVLVSRYLRQEIDDAEEFAFVEYWGRGYTQDCLARLMTSTFDRPLDTRMYYARSINPSQGTSVRYNFTASAYNFLAVEAIFANLPYGTTEGYLDAGDRVEPVTTARTHDAELYAALESQLPRFARDYARLPILDQASIDRDVYRFAFLHYRDNPEDPYYTRRLAPLKDAAQLGDQEREYAPAFDVRALVRLVLRHDKLSTFTQSPEMSLKRSSPLVQLAYRIGRHESTIAARRAVQRAGTLRRTLDRMLVASRG